MLVRMRRMFVAGLVAFGSALVACGGKSTVGGTGGAAGNGGNGGKGGSSASGGSGGSGGVPAKSGKVDLLFMIDNSVSMSDKQTVLARSTLALVERLVDPECVAPDGTLAGAPAPDAPCAAGTSREFQPVTDIHIGVITSSLGGHGSTICTPGWSQWDPSQDEHAHLLGVSRSGLQSYNGTGFLAWDPGARYSPPGANDPAAFGQDFSNMVDAAGERGCGFEAQLEAWYRFLVDPDPPASVTKNASGATTANGTDGELLAERANFLRPDSLLSIVMITDENDCSVADTGLGWLIGYDAANLPTPTSICATDPDNKCCHSCGLADPAGCTHDPICDTQPNLPSQQDAVNLRCWDQRRRFGIATDPTHPEAGLLYPTQRYSNALRNTVICPDHLDLACGKGDKGVPNPIYSDLAGSSGPVRAPNQVFFAGIVGVPWQDIASTDTLQTPDALRYMTAAELTSQGRWDVILGDPASYTPPSDPLMQESVFPRSGSNPITHDAVAPPGSGPTQNPINGHEYSNAQTNDLQYACIFKLDVPKDCSSLGYGCDCTAGQAGDKPLCQDPSTGQVPSAPTQFFAKAYPGLRELQVLKDVGDSGIVASVCPRIQDPTNPDYGYNPALDAIVERIKVGLY